MNYKIYKKNKKNKGALLFELLIVISLLAIILSVVSNAMFLSMRSNKVSGEYDVAIGLVSESLEAVRAFVEEDWKNLYNLNKGINSKYYPTDTSGKWSLVLSSLPSELEVIINGTTYKRYIIVENVSRDINSRNIESNYNVNNEDVSTQKVTVYVEWVGGNPIVISEYFFRWKNKTEVQTDWSGGNNGGINPTGTIDTSTGQIKLQ